jgi:hypothetical protein
VETALSRILTEDFVSSGALVVRTRRASLLAAVALPAVAAAAWAWRRQGTSPEVRAVTALAGCFLLTPYALLYDQVPLVVAAAFLTRAGLRDGFLPWERLGICLACALPAAALFLHSGLIAPAAWVLLLGLALRRMAISSRPTRR